MAGEGREAVGGMPVRGHLLPAHRSMLPQCDPAGELPKRVSMCRARGYMISASQDGAS